MGDLNAKIGNNKVNSNVSIQGESTVNRNCKRLTDYVIYNNYKANNTFSLIKIATNIHRWQEALDQL
jgi:hypothetical protein